MTSSANDPVAFAEAYAQHLPPIVRYLRRRLGDAAAEDAASEVFLRAYREGRADSPSVAPTLPWLYGIATNVISEQRRAERRRWRTLEKLARDSPGISSAPAPDGLDPQVLDALKKLSRVDRETLLLTTWGELSGDEVAAVLNVPAGTVRSRLSRARRQLSEALRDSNVINAQPLAGDPHA